MSSIKLGVNIDHVATVRQARRETLPDPVEAALAAIRGGATGITAHLREDRRHIQDADIVRLKKELPVPLNMEMALVPSVIRVAERVRPAWVCVVPERRQELTTEGGLNVKQSERKIGHAVERLKSHGVRISLFLGADVSDIKRAGRLGVDAVEIHTGTYARAWPSVTRRQRELNRLRRAAETARAAGLLVNAGHGLTCENVGSLASLFSFHEFNIGFSIVARAFFVGMEKAVSEMKERMDQACVES